MGDNKTSGIIEQSLIIRKVKRKEATHFAMCSGNRIRYLISLDKMGKLKLCRNLSSYSSKLSLLVKLLRITPFNVLEKAKLGYYVSVDLNNQLRNQLQDSGSTAWNVIIGTYDEKQKLVIQDFSKENSETVYIKIGNEATKTAMKNEMDFLSAQYDLSTFVIPELVKKVYFSESSIFSIQITKEFIGEKVEIGLTHEIVEIYKEIAAIDESGDLEFSHGDFTPWNLKKYKSGYVVYDWEHCGKRMRGFDLLHYVVMPRVMLNNMTINNAIEEGIAEIRLYIPEFHIDKEQFITECRKLRLERNRV